MRYIEKFRRALERVNYFNLWMIMWIGVVLVLFSGLVVKCRYGPSQGDNIPVDIQRQEVIAYEKQVDNRMDTMLKIIGSHTRLQKHVIELESRVDSLERKLEDK